jgi:hypothetical protein
MMHAGRRHQMSHVVHLEILPVAKRHSVRVALTRAHQRRRVNVAIRPLRLRDDVDGALEVRCEESVVRHRERGADRFEQFVEISIVEWGATWTPFGESGRDAKVLKVLRVIRPFHQPDHAREHVRAKIFEAIKPKAICPARFVEANGMNFRVRTVESLGERSNSG